MGPKSYLRHGGTSWNLAGSATLRFFIASIRATPSAVRQHPGVDLSSDDKRALDDFCARVRTRFHGRVREIALFGSRARDDAREDSDIDVCVVIDDLTFEEQRDIDAITAAVLETDGVALRNDSERPERSGATTDTSPRR
jgi:hypothetical protein